MNQNLLIVDDEKKILAGLEELFRYDFDMEIDVYTANSAQEALNLLNSVRFDVVLTDIKMPGMDGIALFEKMKENWPRCKTVFLTGYRDFDDMYRVINHKDVKYILKMEDDETIMDAVREFLVQSRMELEQQQEKEMQEIQTEKIRQWMQKEYVDHILSGNFELETAPEKLKELGINLNAKRQFLIFLIRIDNKWKKGGAEGKYYYAEGLQMVLQQNVPDKLKVYAHILDESNVMTFIQQGDGEDWKQTFTIAFGALEYAQESFASSFGHTFSAVTGTQPCGMEECAKTLEHLRNLLNGYLGGKQNFIFNESSFPIPDFEVQTLKTSNMAAALQSCLALHKKEKYDELLDQYLKEITDRSSRHDPVALEVYYNISTSLLHFINENHLEQKLAFKVGIYKLTNVDAHGSWEEAADYLREISEAIFSLFEENENFIAQRALKRVIEYIGENLEGDLSLTRLADVGGFNASYLSRLFKQAMNETIGEYVLKKRIGLAKNLLSDGNVKIQDIAVRTGYTSPQAFTRIFHKEVGISPKEYRENLIH